MYVLVDSVGEVENGFNIVMLCTCSCILWHEVLARFVNALNSAFSCVCVCVLGWLREAETRPCFQNLASRLEEFLDDPLRYILTTVSQCTCNTTQIMCLTGTETYIICMSFIVLVYMHYQDECVSQVQKLIIIFIASQRDGLVETYAALPSNLTASGEFTYESPLIFSPPPSAGLTSNGTMSSNGGYGNGGYGNRGYGNGGYGNGGYGNGTMSSNGGYGNLLDIATATGTDYANQLQLAHSNHATLAAQNTATFSRVSLHT